MSTSSCSDDTTTSLKSASHYSDKTGNIDANTKCWAQSYQTDRTNQPTADERQMSVGRRCSALVNRGPQSHCKDTSLGYFFSSFTYHLTCPFLFSENQLPGLSWLIPEGDFSSPIPFKAKASLFLLPLALVFSCSCFKQMATVLVVTVHDCFMFDDCGRTQYMISTDDQP